MRCEALRIMKEGSKIRVRIWQDFFKNDLEYKPLITACLCSRNKLCLNLNKANSFYTRGADKSLAWPGRKQATATEDFESHISYL